MDSDILLAQTALRDLVMRYCRGCDRRDFALVRACYHDDAIDDHGGMFHGSADAFVAWLPDAMAPWDLTIHEIYNSVIVVDGDRAQGEHQVRAWHRSLPPDRREYIIWGRYLDRYSRRDGVWKFSHRQLVFDHGETRRVDEAALGETGQGVPAGTAGRDDPSWQYDLLAGLGK